MAYIPSPHKPDPSSCQTFRAGRPAKARRADFDLLNVISCFAVFLAHVLLIFGPYPLYHLKNSTFSVPVGIVYEFVRDTMMALFFLLAGWSSMASIRSAGAGNFIRKRCRRLLVPFFAGIYLLCPAIKYIELLGGTSFKINGPELLGPIPMSFVEFLPKYYARFNWVTWSHLWFLVYLMFYCLVFLPVLVRLAREDSETGILHLPGWLAYVPFVPLGLLLACFKGWWPFYPSLWKDWVNLGYFGLFFLIGAVMETCPAFERCVRRNWAPLGLIGLAGFAGVVWNVETDLGRFLVAVAAWGCACGFMGLAARFHPVENKLVKYLREASLPIYLLHHTVVLVLGWYVVHLDAGIAVKIAILLPLSVLITFSVYEGLIRRLPVLRFLFGMHPLRTGRRPASKQGTHQREIDKRVSTQPTPSSMSF
ncbi:MAG: acyltransferase family protein [Syntrophobacteraceae bacterium]|jgi:peptidoglycan/LPS O-acetylase OafA/YrhL